MTSESVTTAPIISVSKTAASTTVPVVPSGVHTVVQHYRPWTGGRVSAGIKVVTRSTGNCTSSIASGRSDAARCFFENFVADPCFIDPVDSSKAACPAQNPYDVTLLTLDPKAVTPSSNVSGDAWLARTTDGVLCRAYTGAGSVTDGVRNWGCTDGELSMAQPQSTATWTGTFTPTNSKKSMKVSMSQVWT